MLHDYIRSKAWFLDGRTSTCSKYSQILGHQLNDVPLSRVQKSNALATKELEYASIIWDPYTKSHIATLEKIQRRAARFVCNNYSRHASVTAMLDMLNWSSLEHRRKEAKCIMFYKIINNLVCVDFHHYLQPITSSTRGHHLRYTHLQARVDVFRHSYLPSTIRLWNMLPAQTVSSTSIDIFKDNLANVQ